MAKPGLTFAGFLYDDAGDAINGATINLYAKNATTTSLANTTTDSNGKWSISHTPASGEAGEYDVQVASGASKRRFKFDDAAQISSLDTEALSVRANEGAAATMYFYADEGEDAGDEPATQDPELFTPEDLDLEAKVSLKIDGQDTEVSFNDLIKGYSTEQSLSKKGRELGDARKNFEEDYNKKLAEVQEMSTASVAVLYKSEQEHAKEFHDLEKKIDEARKDGNSYDLTDLKDKREQKQKEYWEARKGRESLQKTVTEKSQEQMTKAWNEQLNMFNEAIPTLIPGFNETVAKDIRAFALKEGINEQVLDTIVDPAIVKFVNDYRILKQGINKGSAKRKAAPAKKIPTRKSRPVQQKQVDAEQALRKRALSKDSSKEDQDAFLRSYAERSLSNM